MSWVEKIIQNKNLQDPPCDTCCKRNSKGDTK